MCFHVEQRAEACAWYRCLIYRCQLHGSYKWRLSGSCIIWQSTQFTRGDPRVEDAICFVHLVSLRGSECLWSFLIANVFGLLVGFLADSDLNFDVRYAKDGSEGRTAFVFAARHLHHPCSGFSCARYSGVYCVEGRRWFWSPFVQWECVGCCHGRRFFICACNTGWIPQVILPSKSTVWLCREANLVIRIKCLNRFALSMTSDFKWGQGV